MVIGNIYRKHIDLEPVYDIAPPRENFQGYDFLNPHGSGHSLVNVLLGFNELWDFEISPILIFRPKPLTLSQYMALLAPRRNFQGYDFPNLHGSWHSLVKVCKVLLER